MIKTKHLEYGSLVGKHIGNLIVDEVHSITSEGVYYLCRCLDCGRYIVLSHHFLKFKKKTDGLNCGCTKRGHIQVPEKFVGQRSGRLVLTGYLYIWNYEYYYSAHCDCGKDIRITLKDFRNRRFQSCGCLADEIYGSNIVYDSEKMKMIPGVSNPEISNYYKAKYKERMDPNRTEEFLYIKKDGTIVNEYGCTFPIRHIVGGPDNGKK